MGVCAAIGRWTNTDPVLWRVIVAVLTFFGGAGLALYIAGWLLIPKAGEDGSISERVLSGRRLTPGNIVVLVLLVLLGAIIVDDGRGGAAVIVIAVIGYLVVRERSIAPGSVAVAPPGTPLATTTPPVGPLPPTWAAPAGLPPYAGPWGGPAPASIRPRERSALGSVTIAVTALVGGVLMALRLGGIEELTTERILASCLVVVGVGLVVGTVVGRARWLFFFPGLVLVLALCGTAAVDGIVGGGVGERTWLVAGGAPSQTYELALGEATLDLQGLDTSGRVVRVDARVGVGHLLLLVPEGLTVRITSRVAFGEIDDGRGDPIEGSGLRREVVIGTGDIQAELDLRVGTGQVEVRRG